MGACKFGKGQNKHNEQNAWINSSVNCLCVAHRHSYQSRNRIKIVRVFFYFDENWVRR